MRSRKQRIFKTRPLVIGLTGALGSGKTTAARWFKRLGAKVICCDELARTALKPSGPLYKKTVRLFGKEGVVSGGAIRRRALGRIVFEDRRKRALLERLIHPFVWQRVRAEIRRAGRAIVVVDIPLLFETKAEKFFDWIVVVRASRKACLDRVVRQGRLTRAEAIRRLAAQVPLAEKCRRADAVLHNTTRHALQKQVIHLWNELQNKTATSRKG